MAELVEKGPSQDRATKTFAHWPSIAHAVSQVFLQHKVGATTPGHRPVVKLRHLPRRTSSKLAFLDAAKPGWQKRIQNWKIEAKMTAAAEMPAHVGQFHYNMTFAITRDGYSTIINVSNYYNQVLFGKDFESACVAEFVFFDQEGREGFHIYRAIPEWGSVHIDVGEELREAGHSEEAIGTVYTRLVPEKLPAMLLNKRTSTECTAEIINPSGRRDFIHNTGGRVHVPSISRAKSGVMFADKFSDPCYIVLVNNYFGPRFPYVSQGIGKVMITNHRGEQCFAWTDPVPARGLRLFSLTEQFPELYEFLDGEGGHLNFNAANLAPKPWIWFGDINGQGDISLEHM